MRPEVLESSIAHTLQLDEESLKVSDDVFLFLNKRLTLISPSPPLIHLDLQDFLDMIFQVISKIVTEQIWHSGNVEEPSDVFFIHFIGEQQIEEGDVLIIERELSEDL